MKIETLKRKALKLKKEEKIPHHEALDKVAKSLGFQNYKHFFSQAFSKEGDFVVMKTLNKTGKEK